MTLKILPVPAFDDNYLWLLHNEGSQQAYAVDPGDAEAINQALSAMQLTLAGFLVTHHHWDHTGGIEQLVEQHKVPVYGPKSDKIPQVTQPLENGAKVSLQGSIDISILEVPGHTLDHIAYYIEDTGHQQAPALFCGDTLFAGGCGRMFEGQPAQMHHSLTSLSSLPSATRVYCAHEYTEANLAFAAAVEPQNRTLTDRITEVQARRAKGLSTVPSTIEIERQTNPFLRCATATVKAAAERQAQQSLATPAEVFGAIRRWKDNF